MLLNSGDPNHKSGDSPIDHRVTLKNYEIVLFSQIPAFFHIQIAQKGRRNFAPIMRARATIVPYMLTLYMFFPRLNIMTSQTQQKDGSGDQRARTLIACFQGLKLKVRFESFFCTAFWSAAFDGRLQKKSEWALFTVVF